MNKLLISLIFTSLAVQASPEIEFSGFGTIGLVTSDSDIAGYREDFSKLGGVFQDQLDLAQSTKLGIQLNATVNEQVDIVIQGVYRNQHDYTFDNTLNLAFLRFKPTPQWEVRVGRTGFDLFYLTDYRDIGFAYPWAHVPTEVYGVVPFRYIDGIDLSYQKPIGSATLVSKIFYGESEYGLTAFSSPNITPNGVDDAKGVAFDYTSFEWEVGLTYTEGNLTSSVVQPLLNGLTIFSQQIPNFGSIWSGALNFAQGLEVNNKKIQYASLIGQYRFENMTLQAELARIRSDSLAVRDIDSGYISNTWHNQQHNFFISYSYGHTKQFDINSTGINVPVFTALPGGQELFEGAQFLLRFININQKTFALGWRWDVQENLSLKLQWDHTRISDKGSSLFQPRDQFNLFQTSDLEVNTLFANVSFLF